MNVNQEEEIIDNFFSGYNSILVKTCMRPIFKSCILKNLG